MIKGAKGAKGFEKSEDPIYVLENNVPIDTQFYLEHQLSQPLLRIFEPIMENPQSLLSGDHTRTIAVATPSVGGLMKFAVKSLTCLGCKTPLSQGEISVCKHCKHRYASFVFFCFDCKTVHCPSGNQICALRLYLILEKNKNNSIAFGPNASGQLESSHFSHFLIIAHTTIFFKFSLQMPGVITSRSFVFFERLPHFLSQEKGTKGCCRLPGFR